jgi:hypothetical protein
MTAEKIILDKRDHVGVVILNRLNRRTNPQFLLLGEGRSNLLVPETVLSRTIVESYRRAAMPELGTAPTIILAIYPVWSRSGGTL